MTEPISDEDLAELRSYAEEEDREGGIVCVGAEDALALLARLDAAEARAHRLDNELTRQAEILSSVKVERDAALARAVPDGHTPIGRKVYRLEYYYKFVGHGDTYRLVPADTEEKP